MNPEKKYSVAIIFVIALISVGAVAVMLVNAKSSQPRQYFNSYFLTGGAVKIFCRDSDEGIIPYKRGFVTTLRTVAIDRCTSVGVVEYSCDDTDRIIADHIPCPYGCFEGSCVKPAITAYAFNPFLKSKIRKVLKS